MKGLLARGPETTPGDLYSRKCQAEPAADYPGDSRGRASEKGGELAADD